MNFSEQMRLQSELLLTKDQLLRFSSSSLSPADHLWLSASITFINELMRQLQDRSCHSTIGKRRRRSSLRKQANFHPLDIFRKSKGAVPSGCLSSRGVSKLAVEVSDNAENGDCAAYLVETASKNL
jgi:hypothetical protein